MSVANEGRKKSKVCRTETTTEIFIGSCKSFSERHRVVVPVLRTCPSISVSLLQAFRSSEPLYIQNEKGGPDGRPFQIRT